MITKSGDTVWHCSSEFIVYIQNSVTPLNFQRIKAYVTLSEDCEASRGAGGRGSNNFEFVSRGLITSTESQKSPSDTHKTPYDLLKRCRERKINITASDRVNVDPMGVIEVSMEMRRNVVAGKAGDSRDDPSTNGIIRTIPTCEGPEWPGRGLSPDRRGGRRDLAPVQSSARSGHLRSGARGNVDLTAAPSRAAGGPAQSTSEQRRHGTEYSHTPAAPKPTVFDSRLGRSQIFACGNRDGRRRWSVGFLGDLPFPPPPHSSAAPYSLCYTPFGSQDDCVKSRSNLFTHFTSVVSGKKGWGKREIPRKPTDQRHGPSRSHLRKSGDPAGDLSWFALVEGEQANRYWRENLVNFRQSDTKGWFARWLVSVQDATYRGAVHGAGGREISQDRQLKQDWRRRTGDVRGLERNSRARNNRDSYNCTSLPADLSMQASSQPMYSPPSIGVTVAERLAFPPPTMANRAQSPARSVDFRKW
ncbi:hypothetical protein PR048_026513 [Dryococelus australis]|uniref:Uncharacterized protein n=1 Tax=Dryococelus australis TaxID=614101 RepID=A0ABQ9GLI3_9NEOP|nr:hypothetical protein PR048_026513 [Dryococelus australis]